MLFSPNTSTKSKLLSLLLSVKITFSPKALHGSVLVSPNFTDTLKNAEQFLDLKEYRTAAALFTVALERLGDAASPQMVATLLCKRAECLLFMVS